MEKKKTTVQQRKAIEIALVLFCVGAILFSWMTDMSFIKIPEELLMKISSIEDFLFTIFSVQASIATVSIAVISIITGFANECYLGVSISEFITTIKPCILTHKRLQRFTSLNTLPVTADSILSLVRISKRIWNLE